MKRKPKLKLMLTQTNILLKMMNMKTPASLFSHFLGCIIYPYTIKISKCPPGTYQI